MPLLHDAAYRASLRARVGLLRADSKPQWGKMSVDQMLWHVNTALNLALGNDTAPTHKPPLPMPLMRFIVVDLPWGKSLPTSPHLIPSGHYDFDGERATCLRLIDEMAQRDLAATWGDHPLLGRMAGSRVSKLQAKHINHHLKQFGV